MSVAKKLLAGTLILAVLGTSGAGALNYIKKSREVEVLVVQVGSLASDYYTEDTVLDGNITTNISQSIRVDKDMIVDQLYVNEGDAVSIGDPLVSFDMTLVEMELNIARLKHQLLERDLAKAAKRLDSLRRGGPIIDTGSESDSEYDPSFDVIEGRIGDGWSQGGFSLASVWHPLLLASLDDFAEDGFLAEEQEETEPPVSREESHIEENGGEDGSDFSDEFASEEEILMQPEETERPEETEQPTPPVENPSDDDFMTNQELAKEWEMNPQGEKIEDFYETDMTFYEILDGSTIPLTGTGTEEDPFIFLCSSEPECIVATGTFLNLMAGYDRNGTELLHEGGFWYQLEFHTDDTVADTEDRMESCYGYFLVDGGLLTEPIYPYAEMYYYKEEATPTEEEIPDDPWGGGGGGGGGSDIEGSDLTRDEAIRLQQSRVNSLKINLEESSINIGKLERKVNNKVVYARLDGIVSNVGDSIGGSSGSLMTVKSKQGYYVTGTIGELMLNDVQPGTKLSCMSYQSGNFDATVLEVADYPLDSGRGGFFGSDSNPNVSYYRFSAEIDDSSVHVMDGDWLQITLKNSSSKGGKLVLSKAFVRSENGKSYVYKEEDGVLKKQYVKVGGNVDYGYSVIVEAGLSRKDYIAFPYGKTVVNGAKTRQGTTEELYGY